ncbi:hypothetical protein GJ496_011736 [Pomphorhynchus laevis]|nr:hypothetical protein GJ496_011736 [Pomphorhynchus laevis]
MSKPVYQMYRNTTLGIALQETIDEMRSNGILSDALAKKILNQFDKSVNEALNKKVRNRCNFRGELSCYRFCDNVWTLIFKNFELRDPNIIIKADKVKIVACDGNCGSGKNAKGYSRAGRPTGDRDGNADEEDDGNAIKLERK